ncbi:MAG: hypothetical protein WBE47_19050 [Candidatus Acidiferrales bacterium]
MSSKNSRTKAGKDPIFETERITKRRVFRGEDGTVSMIAEPIKKATPEPKSKGRINPITAARHLSALDSLLRRGVIDENRHAEEVTMLKAACAAGTRDTGSSFRPTNGNTPH